MRDEHNSYNCRNVGLLLSNYAKFTVSYWSIGHYIKFLNFDIPSMPIWWLVHLTSKSVRIFSTHTWCAYTCTKSQHLGKWEMRLWITKYLINWITILLNLSTIIKTEKLEVWADKNKTKQITRRSKNTRETSHLLLMPYLFQLFWQQYQSVLHDLP